MSLHVAAGFTGNADVIRTLITAGADPNAQTGNGATPLHYAVENNHDNPDVIDALLVAGADPNVQNDGGQTPLHVAARTAENPAVIEALLDRDADPNAQTEYGRTPLHSAAEGNANVAAIQVLIAAGADANAQVQYYGGPLHFAARSNPNPAVVEALLRAGADLHGQTEYGGTAFHAAAVNENPAVIETFLRAGVDVNGRGDFGELAVHSAAEFNGNPEVIQALLRAGADPYLDDDGTALHAAARRENGSVAAMQALIDFGMEATVRAGSGLTPLHNVRWPQAAEFLLANGADPRLRDASGNTPLHRGFRWTSLDSETVLELVALLVNAGGNVNARNENGRTPMHDASNSALNALLAHGADINAQDEDGNTRLHLASGCEFVSCHFASELIIALLDAGADATIRNAQGQTPWDLASANEHEEFSGSDGYWQLNDARFNAPSTQNVGTSSGVAVSSLPSSTSASPAQSGANGTCEIPGFYDGDAMSESVMENLRLSWCPLGSSSRRRLFALQAELAWCRLNVKPPPENMSEFLQTSRRTCNSLAAIDESARTATGPAFGETPVPYVRRRCPVHFFQ